MKWHIWKRYVLNDGTKLQWAVNEVRKYHSKNAAHRAFKFLNQLVMRKYRAGRAACGVEIYNKVVDVEYFVAPAGFVPRHDMVLNRVGEKHG
jgi:hypothetical protein